MTPRVTIGAHTLPYAADTFDRALEGIAGAGFTHIGIYTQHADGPVISADPTPAELTALGDKLAQHGLTAMSMFARSGSTSRIDRLRVDLEVCSALGIPLLLGAGPWPLARSGERKPEMHWYGEVEQFLTTLSVAAPVAEQLGVTIVLKPHRGATATGADILDVVHRIDSAAVRACWDAGNIRFYEGLDSEHDLEASGIAPYVKSVAIKDHRGNAGDAVFPIPGDGEVDHARMLSTLLASGFDGPLLIERFDQPDATANDRALAQSHRYLTGTVEAAAR